MIAPAYVGLNRDSSDAFAFTRPEFDGQGLLPAFKALQGARARLSAHVRWAVLGARVQNRGS